jgi:hypothetical protein
LTPDVQAPLALFSIKRAFVMREIEIELLLQVLRKRE